ncbi:hypothetical protein BD770DRAFT_216517 [Pilaira anomala]|nr:hypothetical protein BD770DRAFT_216517 [Pilaira anomala]
MEYYCLNVISNYCCCKKKVFFEVVQNKKCFKSERNVWFLGVVGYHVCLTRRRSPVQVWQKSFFAFSMDIVRRLYVYFFFTTEELK